MVLTWWGGADWWGLKRLYEAVMEPPDKSGALLGALHLNI